MNKHFYLRALGITTLKTITLATLSLLVIQFIASNIPIKVHALVMILVFLLLTFLFGEWIFSARIPPRGIVIVMIATYLLDTFLNILIWSFILEVNLFFTQTLQHHLLYFAMHALAMGAAAYDRKRMGVGGQGPVEGLVR